MAGGRSLSARLVVSRTSKDDIGIRGLELRLDGEFLDNLSFGKTIEHELAPGEHTLLATNSLYKQNATFTVEEGETARFEAMNVLTGLGRVMMAIGGGIYRVELRRLSS